jgi:hypothetical protein
MNEQDAKILEMYLRDNRKKKISFLILIILFIAVFLLYGYYTKYKQSINEIDNSIQEEIQNNNIINEIDSKEENTSTTENITAQENTEKQLNEVQETQIEEKQETTQKDENKKQETKEKTTDNTKTTVISENKEKKASEKPANKDFLFTDGYTMDNVTQAAQDYLQSFSCSGECIPIKDKEGVYLGMRVTFY